MNPNFLTDATRASLVWNALGDLRRALACDGVQGKIDLANHRRTFALFVPAAGAVVRTNANGEVAEYQVTLDIYHEPREDGPDVYLVLGPMTLAQARDLILLNTPDDGVGPFQHTTFNVVGSEDVLELVDLLLQAQPNQVALKEHPVDTEL